MVPETQLQLPSGVLVVCTLWHWGLEQDFEQGPEGLIQPEAALSSLRFGMVGLGPEGVQRLKQLI